MINANSDNRISDYKLANKYLLSKGQLLHRIGVFPFCTILRLKIEKSIYINFSVTLTQTHISQRFVLLTQTLFLLHSNPQKRMLVSLMLNLMFSVQFPANVLMHAVLWFMHALLIIWHFKYIPWSFKASLKLTAVRVNKDTIMSWHCYLLLRHQELMMEP